MILFLVGLSICFILLILVHFIWGKQIRKSSFFRNFDLSYRGLILALGILIVSLSTIQLQAVANPINSLMATEETTPSPVPTTTPPLMANSVPAEDSTTTAVTTTESITTTEVTEATTKAAATAEKTTKTVPITTSTATTSTAATSAITDAVTTDAVTTKAVTKVETTQGIQSTKYADGVFTGKGYGFRGLVSVAVTISGGIITDISVTDHREDLRWYEWAYQGTLERIYVAQTSDVDTVSGATYSSIGIRDGVAEALSKSKAAYK